MISYKPETDPTRKPVSDVLWDDLSWAWIRHEHKQYMDYLRWLKGEKPAREETQL